MLTAAAMLRDAILIQHSALKKQNCQCQGTIDVHSQNS